MYTASTLSHLFDGSPWRRLFRSLDQASIYLLIVGTYTAFGFSYLRTGVWLPLSGVMWIVALYGCAAKVASINRPEAVRVWSYLLLAWMPFVVARWLLQSVLAMAFWCMFGGGVCYTAGTLFLAGDQRHRYFHAIGTCSCSRPTLPLCNHLLVRGVVTDQGFGGHRQEEWKDLQCGRRPLVRLAAGVTDGVNCATSSKQSTWDSSA